MITMITMICPICKLELKKVDNTYQCQNRHCFDISKYNYVNLLTSRSKAGDNKLQITARHQFLNCGYYLPLANMICDILASYNVKTVLDGGCGSGYYSKILNEKFEVYSIDISKDAVEKAAKQDKLGNYIVASSQNIPFNDNTFDAATFIFAPVFAVDTLRVLKQNGILVIVLPGAKHLFELKKAIYNNPYLNKEPLTKLDGFTLDRIEQLKFTFTPDNINIKNLITMTPYFYKTASDDLRKINDLEHLDITADFLIYIYKADNNS